MHSLALIPRVLLVSTLGTLSAVGLSACAGAPTRANDSTLGADPREADAQRALEGAQQKGTIEAYEAVMKGFEGTDAAGTARIEVARRSSEEALVAVGRGDWEGARVLADRALGLGDPMIAQVARSTLKQVDRADCREAAARVDGALEMDPTIKGCTKAIGIVGSTMGSEPSKQLESDLRKATLQQLTMCIQQAVDAAKPNDDFALVRKALESEDAKRAYGEDTQFSLMSALNSVVVSAMEDETKKDVAQGRWTQAFETFEAWARDGKAGPAQVEAAKQNARDEITSTLLRKGKAAMGKRTAEVVRSDVIKAFEVFEGMNVSQDLVRMRDHLTTWVECEKLGCIAEQRPKGMYNFGAAPLHPHPPTSPTGAGTVTLPNGTKVWVLARSPMFSLITNEDPGQAGSWELRLSKAKGWIETKVLEREDTSAWLPIGQALVGERVWLPTGREDNLYLLGVVKSVSDKDITVEKISDGRPATVERTDLRSGILTKGTKVLAFCRDTIHLTEARLEQVVKGDTRAPRADIVCLAEDGSEGRRREEQLGALRAKPDWLPPRRP